MLRVSSRATYFDMALMGLVGGLGLGVLNVILYVFFLLPMVAHHFFHTYLHYDAGTLGYAAGYVGTFGIMGVIVGLLAPRAVVKTLCFRRTASELLRQSPEFANDGPSGPN